ncbi:unnamed protein product [Lota lota]
MVQHLLPGVSSSAGPSPSPQQPADPAPLRRGAEPSIPAPEKCKGIRRPASFLMQCGLAFESQPIRYASEGAFVFSLLVGQPLALANNVMFSEGKCEL